MTEPLCDYLRRHHDGMVVAGMRGGGEVVAMPGDQFDMGGGIVVELVDVEPYVPNWRWTGAIIALGCVALVAVGCF